MTPRQQDYFREVIDRERLQAMKVLNVLIAPEKAGEILDLAELEAVIKRMLAKNASDELATALSKIYRQCNQMTNNASNGNGYKRIAIDRVFMAYGNAYAYYYEEALELAEVTEEQQQ